MSIKVYLAGPIAGCTESEAKTWRDSMEEFLNNIGMTGVSPLRCEPIHGERYGLGYDDPRFGTARAIGSKNFIDVQRCDVTLAYLPRGAGTSPYSLGTVAEIAWAFSLRKPVIVVSDDPYIQDHPVINACAGWMLTGLDEAIDVIGGIFDVYN